MEKEQIVRETLKKRFIALEGLDYGTLQQSFHHSAQIIQSGRFQVNHSPSEYVKWIEALFAKVEFSQYQVKDIQFFETVAIASESYQFHYVRKADGINCVGYGNASSVLKLLEGRWQIIQMCIGNHTLELETAWEEAA
ncbi:MAG: nuclear transport factor 2 family protein [Spirosomaceae bacterium]|jgi:hypothetical protein|nr:nuclear transport factor 2 family protein [Spirosomataceae bacterium]